MTNTLSPPCQSESRKAHPICDCLCASTFVSGLRSEYSSPPLIDSCCVRPSMLRKRTPSDAPENQRLTALMSSELLMGTRTEDYIGLGWDHVGIIAVMYIALKAVARTGHPLLVYLFEVAIRHIRSLSRAMCPPGRARYRVRDALCWRTLILGDRPRLHP
jgi:hypothetical protein